jgi:hypothetical protein
MSDMRNETDSLGLFEAPAYISCSIDKGVAKRFRTRLQRRGATSAEVEPDLCAGESRACTRVRASLWTSARKIPIKSPFLRART